MTKQQAVHNFWKSFGLSAYDENTVPDEAKLPYITYETADDEFNNDLYLSAMIWYRSSSWAEITEKEEEIADFISRGGRMVAYDNGAFWLRKGTPWAQRMPEEADEMVRKIALNIVIEFLD